MAVKIAYVFDPLNANISSEWLQLTVDISVHSTFKRFSLHAVLVIKC